MLTTRFTRLVGCSIPIQQAGMGPLSTPRLAAAVINAGGLGMVSVGGNTPEEIIKTLDSVFEIANGPIGANFLMPFVDPSRAHACVAAAATRARVIDFFYADPNPALIETAHSGGALACWQVGSREEALAAVQAGCDFIIAQGIEAGGHLRGKISLMALLNEILEVVEIPVLAAGGIGSGRAMAAALAAGAEGVRVGTRFIAAEEAEADPRYVQALINARAEDTIYTELFSVGWPIPNAPQPHRVLSSNVAAAQAFQGDIVAEVQDETTGQRTFIPRFAFNYPGRKTSGAVEAMAHYAGESVDGVKKLQPAVEIVQELAAGAEKLLRFWSS